MPRNRLIAALPSPYVLLSFAILCWGGNFVAARLANADIPPVALSFWRHTFAALLVLPFILPLLRTDWPNIRAKLGNFALMGLVLAIGNTLVYFAVLHTTVINAALINSGVPVAAVAAEIVRREAKPHHRYRRRVAGALAQPSCRRRSIGERRVAEPASLAREALAFREEFAPDCRGCRWEWGLHE